MAQPGSARADLRVVKPGSPTVAALVATDVGATRGALTSWRPLVAIMCVVLARTEALAQAARATKE
jgi:hypothetical protein